MLSSLHTAYFHECFKRQSSELLGVGSDCNILKAILNWMSLDLLISECVIFIFMVLL